MKQLALVVVVRGLNAEAGFTVCADNGVENMSEFLTAENTDVILTWYLTSTQKRDSQEENIMGKSNTKK